MKATSLYVHVPYCASKCIYCDFFSGGKKTADWNRLTEALINELQERKQEFNLLPDSLYIGGGTPSLMPPDDFVRMVEGLNKIVNAEGMWREFTVEVNPDDVSEELCLGMKSVGVNRVSMGIQTLSDEELKAIRRRHDACMALRAYDYLQRHFSNVSVDLMFGIPGQTVESWVKTVDRIIGIRPQHLSAYSLMLEEGTPLTTLYNMGRVELPADEECDKMWRLLSEMLQGAGYEQYEISNYSLPGYRSVHNSRYWSGNQYVGLGPSAHSYDGHNVRRCNPADIRGYLDHYLAKNGRKDAAPFYEEEILTKEELIEEHILTRMRTREGICLEAFCEEFGLHALQKLLDNAVPLQNKGLVNVSGDHLSLTTDGIMVSNQVILSLSM